MGSSKWKVSARRTFFCILAKTVLHFFLIRLNELDSLDVDSIFVLTERNYYVTE